MAARLPDHPQSGARLLRCPVQRVVRSPRMQGHHADAVSDDIVQLPSNPVAFVGHRSRDPFLPGPFSPGGSMLGVEGPLVTVRHDPAEDENAAHDNR